MNIDLFLFTQVDLAYDKVDLAGIVIHKWVTTFWNILYFKILPAKFSAGHRRDARLPFATPVRPNTGISSECQTLSEKYPKYP